MPRQGVLLSILVLFFADAVPTPARAQIAAGRREFPSVHRVLTRIGDDSPRTVRLAGRTIGRVDGNRMRLRGDSLVLSTANGSRVVALAEVDSLWVQRSAARPLAIIAAVPCALYGALLGEFLATDPDSNGRPGRGTAGALRGGAVGGIICGSLGAGIGSLIKRWRLEYVRT